MKDTSDFEAYLRAKKIDPHQFKQAETEQYQVLKKTFMAMHPDSFTAQKLFLINPIRRKFRLQEEKQTASVKPKKSVFRPKIKSSNDV